MNSILDSINLPAERLSGLSVLVIGDLMLDEYIWGDVRRISPEAPVPIVEVRRYSYVPGGAANVAANISALGAKPLLAGICGNDAKADILRQALAERNIQDLSGICVSDDRPTIVKTRIVSHNQHMLRLDTETNSPIGPKTEQDLLQWVAKQIPNVQACILSDYAKGTLTENVCQEITRIAHANQAIVLVDPKGTDYTRYRYVDFITPNLNEIALATKMPITSDDDLHLAVQHLMEILPGTNILVTLGAKGMMFFGRDHSTFHLNALAKSVYDVTGAGDTVIATLALCLAHGLPPESAVKTANIAAGLVVQKFGTATVSVDEILGLRNV